MKTRFGLSLVWLLLVATLPAQTTTRIHHTFYDLTYYTKQCSSIMGFYVQTADHTAHIRQIDRTSFTADDKAPHSCAVDFDKVFADYNVPFSGDLQQRIDKGHINPYQAFSFTDAAADESMLYSNVCPQISHVNEQEWRRVEAEVIKRSKSFGDVKVWTGVLISTSHPQLVGSLLKPDFYWKVISYKVNGLEKQEAWLSKNDSTNTHTLASQAVNSVAHVRDVINQYYRWFSPGF
jgi:endonuclease G, mitochondrial